MAPNATDITRRLRLELKIDSQTQYLLLRVRDTVGEGWQDTVATEFVEWLSSDLLGGGLLEGASDKSQIDLLSGAYADIGSDFFIPTTLTDIGEIQAGDSGTETPLTAATLVSFSGRSAGGVGRFFLRGLHVTTYSGDYSDFRLSSAENTDIETALTELDPDTGSLGQLLCATDNTPILYWKPYMNVSVSRRYINHARSL
jgi:hypothetical protein